MMQYKQPQYFATLLVRVTPKLAAIIMTYGLLIAATNHVNTAHATENNTETAVPHTSNR